MKVAVAFCVGLNLWAGAVRAEEASSWLARMSIYPIQPKPHNHAQVHVRDGVAISFAGTYMMSRHWGIETMASLPIEHDLALRDMGVVASTDDLLSTLSVQYHFFDPNGRVRAYVGAGFNYTLFFNERTSNAWGGADLQLSSSLGPAVQAGLDLDLGPTWFISLDARWLDIDTRARLNGTAMGTVEVDPYAVGMSIGRRLP
jgi:outer membrane protein